MSVRPAPSRPIGARARVIRWATWASFAGGTISAPGRRLMNHSTILSMSAARRLIAGHAVGVEVPADRLGTQHVAFEAELGLADRDLLLVVEPGGGDVPLAGEDQDLDHRQPAPDGVFVDQAGRGDRPVVGVRAEHDQRPIRAQHVPQRFADVDELAMASLAPDRVEQLVESGRQWSGEAVAVFIMVEIFDGACGFDHSEQ